MPLYYLEYADLNTDEEKEEFLEEEFGETWEFYLIPDENAPSGFAGKKRRRIA